MTTYDAIGLGMIKLHYRINLRSHFASRGLRFVGMDKDLICRCAYSYLGRTALELAVSPHLKQRPRPGSLERWSKWLLQQPVYVQQVAGWTGVGNG